MILSDLRETLLPDSMREICGLVGLSATLALIHTYAGTKIYLPAIHSLSEGHPVVRLLGMNLAMRLAERMGGDFLIIASATKMQESVRDDHMRERFRGGESVRSLAKEYCLHERQVFRIIAKGRVPA